MTNKEKLEIIDKQLDELYKFLNNGVRIFYSETKGLNVNIPKDITQAIYNLESTRLLLEPIENCICPIVDEEPDENYFKRKKFIV